MHLIDQYAYSNRIRSTDPAQKAGLALLVLALCLLLNRPAVGLLAAIWMWGLATVVARLPWRVFGRVLLAEGMFLALSVVGVAISIGSAPPADAIGALALGPLWIGVGQAGLVFQNPDEQLFSASVGQDISFGPLNLDLSVEETRRRVEAAAALCEIADLLERPTHALSGGQKARVALAGVLAMEPRVLLADEALAGLDPWMQRQALGIFDRLAARGVAVLLATHDLALARRWPELVVVMAGGLVLATDTPERVFADARLRGALGPPELWDDQ